MSIDIDGNTGAEMIAEIKWLREALGMLVAAIDLQASLINVETNIEGWNKCLDSGEQYRDALAGARAALASPLTSGDRNASPNDGRSLEP